MQIIETIAQKLGVKNWQVEAAVKLIDEGNTIPFIARYRKEATGTLIDEQLRELGESLTYLRSLEERKGKVMESIAEQHRQGKGTSGACGLYFGTEEGKRRQKRGAEIYKRRERSCGRGGGYSRRDGHHRGADLRRGPIPRVDP